MERVYNNLKHTIERGLERSMPEKAKLILLGQMHYAMIRGDLTIKEVERLEALLGRGLEDERRAMSYALFGDDEAAEEDRVAA